MVGEVRGCARIFDSGRSSLSEAEMTLVLVDCPAGHGEAEAEEVEERSRFHVASAMASAKGLENASPCSKALLKVDWQDRRADLASQHHHCHDRLSRSRQKVCAKELAWFCSLRTASGLASWAVDLL